MSSVAEYFPQDDARPTLGINLIEFSGDDAEDVDARVRAFVDHLRTDTSVERLGHTLATGDDAVKRVYAMRKRAVGLLGNAGRGAPAAVRRGHRGAARKPCRVHRRIPRAARRPRAAVRDVRARRCRRAARAAGARHEDPKQAALVRPVSDAVAGSRSVTAACCGASTARACAPNMRRRSSASCIRRCSN